MMETLSTRVTALEPTSPPSLTPQRRRVYYQKANFYIFLSVMLDFAFQRQILLLQVPCLCRGQGLLSPCPDLGGAVTN